ncbi:MAG: fimbrial assembly protein [Gammaproteobacteria bacterium HGW-Gammaproteobacteria-3]|nr:MAG: fimbrial assembly protein [Gammaproteobacteria bacterium HGW-Gammaproteobacteria-3]
MANLDTTINLDFKKFLRWWGKELSFLLPETLRQIINDNRGRLLVHASEASLRLFYQINGKTELLAEFQRDAAGLADLKAWFQQDTRFDKAECVVRLSVNDAFAKELVFPVAVADNLPQVVAFELDRYTPFKPEQVYFSVKLLEKNKSSGQLRCVLVLTPREQLDRLYEDLSSAGLKPDRVDYEALIDDDEPYNLLPEQLRQKKPVLPKIVHGGLLSAWVLLLIAALVLPVWWQDRAVKKLRSYIQTIETQAQQVDKLQGEIDVLKAQTQQLIDKKRNSPSVLEMLDALSALIKDDTWLLYLRYSNGRVQIQGQSPSASRLIALLEESEWFANARFDTPVTQDVRTGLERFQITVDAKPVSTQ